MRTVVPLVVFLTSLLCFALAENLPLIPGPRLFWILSISLLTSFCSFLLVCAMTAPLKEVLRKAERVMALKKKEESELLDIYMLLQKLSEVAEEGVYGLERKDVDRLDYLVPLGLMAATTVHEIKNPLATIRGMAELMKEKAGEKERIYLQKLVEATERIDDLAKALLDLSDRELVLEPVQLKDLLLQIVEHQRVRFPLVRVELCLSEVEVMADRKKIYQSVDNILQNALEFERNGGYVRLELKRDEHGAYLSVFNGGSTIDKDDLPHIFKPFFSKKKGGRGLGLYIARKNVRLHGGEITVEAKEGVTFSIFLPLRK